MTLLIKSPLIKSPLIKSPMIKVPMIKARDGRGMVTAELAVTILAAFAVLTMMCWGIYLVVTQLRCVDAAAAVARQAARADDAAVAKAKAGAPSGATITIEKRPSLVTVVVRVRARPLGRWLVAVPLEVRAQVVPEPAAR
jgi:hypothetical protein